MQFDYRLSGFERDLFSTAIASKPVRVSLKETTKDDSDIECIEEPPKKRTKKQLKADQAASSTIAQRKAAKSAVGNKSITKPTKPHRPSCCS